MFNLKLIIIFISLNLALSACSSSSNSSEPTDNALIKPVNNSKIAGPSITFEWTNITNEASYTLEISSREDFSGEPIYIDAEIPVDKVSYTIFVPVLEVQKRYYWRVTARLLNNEDLLIAEPSAFLFVNQSGIHFEDVSIDAGINHVSPSFGVSWGDFNGDGWLDLWSGNHYTKPSLYINQGDGSFIDIATTWEPEITDAHGAAWIDLDGDGKDELLQLSGGNINNRLIKNVDNNIVDKAISYGLDLPGPRGRSPLWLDWNNDNNNDVVLTRIQNSVTQPLALKNIDGAFTDYTNILNITMDDSNYSQLGDLNGDKKLDLIFHNRVSFPSRVYDTSTEPFQNILSQLTIPINTTAATYDTVIADFDNNLRNDIFVVKRRFDIELYQRSESQLDAKIIQTANYPVKKYSFVTTGAIKVSAYFFNDNFNPLSQVFIGTNKVISDQFTNSVDVNPIFKQVVVDLDPLDVRTNGQLDSVLIEQDIDNSVVGAEGLFIGFDSVNNEWQIISSLANQTVNIVVESTGLITSTDTGPYWTGLPDTAPLNLYMHKNENIYAEESAARGFSEAESCGAVVGADFDNDMDIDLYLVCTNGVSNVPNKLFENDGNGQFKEVENAAGASASNVGQGENVAFADYDKDGFLDLFVVNGESLAPFHNGPHQLFRNMPNANHWIQIELKSSFGAQKGIGATVIVETNGVSQMREQNGGYHRYSQNAQLLHFGLGDNEIIETITIYWPSGSIQVLNNVDVDQILTIQEK